MYGGISIVQQCHQQRQRQPTNQPTHTHPPSIIQPLPQIPQSQIPKLTILLPKVYKCKKDTVQRNNGKIRE